MDRDLTPVYQLLQKLITLHRQLLDCVRAEKTALVNADLKGIQDATCFKEGIIEQIRMSDAERAREVRRLAALYRKPEAELTLQGLIMIVQGRDLKSADQLRSALGALTHLIQRIKEQNEDNRGLVERSLDHIQKMKNNVLGEASPAQATYTAQGQKSPPPTGSRLISREA